MSVVPLRQAEPTTAGGKAAALAVLLRAGLDVPDGFVVTTQEQGRPLGPGSDLRTALEAALVRLTGSVDGGHVAARSSATDEDAAGASAAGQHESVLAVRGVEALEAALLRCWASLDGPRARAYREGSLRSGEGSEPGEENRLREESRPGQGTRPGQASGQDATPGSSGGPAMAVLVQVMVDADVSGVLFTGSPRVVEATPGLGLPLVSGTVTPDAWTLDGAGIRQTRVGLVAARCDREGDGLVERPWSSAGPCLTDEQVRAIDKVGRQVEDVLGHPADIEWALRDGRVRVLQARPITAALPGLLPTDLGTGALPEAHPTPRSAARLTDLAAAGAADAAGAAGGLRVLTGIAASGGSATGPVRILRGPGDFSTVRPGDVLVARTTDPAWTPLFQVAAAVVTEAGGLLSHAAIVAREIGIPAVLAVEGATRRLRDGDQVRVDGAAGTVAVVDRDTGVAV